LKKSELIDRLESYRRHEESSESSESSEDEKKKSKSKKSSSSKKVSSAAVKTAPLVDDCDAIAIVYSIESDKHPFHHLDGQFASVELEIVFEQTKEEVEKGKTIEFIKSIGDEHQLVSAVISSDKVFKIPKKKAGKFVIGSSDM
jgi:chromatin segregation and condensation protein Rec8/ScpA/Scc1 (kleisin family)